MELIITPPQQIADELMAIDNFLNITMNEDAEEASARGNDLAAHIARSGKLLADAKYWLNEKKKSEIFDMLSKVGKAAGATNTVINELTKSLCKEEQFLVDFADRVNRTATHQLEWCRTLISKAKAEMQFA
jgi:hypothetical protein